MSDSIFTKLKNKVSYKINEAVEDPEAQKFAEEKEKKEKEIEPIKPPQTEEEKAMAFLMENEEEFRNDILSQLTDYFKRYRERPNTNDSMVWKERRRMEEIMMEEVKNTYSMQELKWRLEDEIEKAESPNPNAFNYKNIPKQIWRNAVRYLPMLMKPAICLFLASLVANDSIMYPIQVRLSFFIITLVACAISNGAITFLAIFYTGKRIYDYYINEMSENPKRLIMPTLYSLLPVLTDKPKSRILSAFSGPLQYGGNFKMGQDDEIAERMAMYQEQLDNSFPYLQKIKTNDPFKGRLDKIAKNFETLHKPIPVEVNENSSESNSWF
jgi:hypothetical protein